MSATDAGFAPLEGLRVIDFSSNIAGPFATMILAQLGADVIKVEPPQGDDARAWSVQPDGTSLVHRYVNAGKRGVVLDLKTPAGVEAARRLCATADVVLQSMRPGVAERLGVDRTSLQERNPGLLYYDLSGYGAGPQGRDMPGYDPLVQATTGIVAMNGYEDGPPVRCAPSVIDLGTGQWIAMGVLAAVLAGRRGQNVAHMETALVDTAFSLVGYQATEARITGRPPPKSGSGNPITAPYQCFSASDGEILIAAPSQRLWEKLVAAIGEPSLLSDTRFRTTADRTGRRDELAAVLDAAIGRKPIAYWTERLREYGVPAARVAGLDESVAGAIAAERSTFAELAGAPLVRLPWMIDGRSVSWRRPAPELGEHTREVLAEIGMDDDAAPTVSGAAAPKSEPPA